MIDFKIKMVDVNAMSIHPELVFHLDLVFKNGEEVPISIQGNLLAEDHKEISSLRQFDEHPIRELKLNIISQDSDYSKISDYSTPVTLKAELDFAALHYIERLRLKNANKDVKLNFQLRIASLVRRTTMRKIKEAQTYSTNKLELLSLEVNPNGGEYLIKQSDWVLHFAPKLGLGNFLLVELPNLDMEKFRTRFAESPFDLVKTTLQQHAEKLSDTLTDMKKYLVQGDFDIVLRRAREFFELLRFQKTPDLRDAFKQIYEARNGTDAGFEDLYKGIFYFFEFSSKFVHELDTKGQLQVKPKAKEEDAYMTYSFCLSLFNFMLQKI